MNYPKTSLILNDRKFEITIESYPLIVMVCLPTMDLTFGNPRPVIDTMARKYEGKVVFGLLNIEENKKINVHTHQLSWQSRSMCTVSKIISAPAFFNSFLVP